MGPEKFEAHRRCPKLSQHRKEAEDLTKADPLERAKARAAKTYPAATITTRNHRGNPLVLATEGDLIRLVRLELNLPPTEATAGELKP